MFSKKVAVRLGALILVAVTGVGVTVAEGPGAAGGVRADHGLCC
ncbi:MULTISPECIES: hypothetical protein [unclassified Nocardioides]|nr:MULTISPECIES: hypothetical protein [unclassified Nocardioides]